MDADHWVFGYGSLMWRPGFAFLDRHAAVLHGHRRAFCIHSVHHRGTYERPGLVLGLIGGGAVRGAAYRVAGLCRGSSGFAPRSPARDCGPDDALREENQ